MTMKRHASSVSAAMPTKPRAIAAGAPIVKCGDADERRGRNRRHEQAGRPSEGSELGNEADPPGFLPEAHAAQQGQAHTQVGAVRNDDVAELVELFLDLRKWHRRHRHSLLAHSRN